MIVQYVAAALIAELHVLSNPASTSNVPVSMGKEDHASMGATGTYRALKSTMLLSQVISNEMICSAEALENIHENPGSGVEKVTKWVRTHVSSLQGDRSMTDECESLANAMLDGEFNRIFE
jgi:histidine ammonia-lyase